MPSRSLPWSKLGSPAGWAGTLPSLQAYFGASWSSIADAFLPTQRLALAIDCPRPGGPGCPRQVVEHGFHDLVAVCGNSPQECDPIPVLRQDVIIHELIIGPWLADLSRLLQIKGEAPEKIFPLTWHLGFYTAAGRAARPVFLGLESDPGKLQLVIMTLLNRHGTSFMLLTPSRPACSASLLLLWQDSGVKLAALDELATLGGANPALWLARYDAGADLDQGSEPDNYFRLENDFWHIRFQGKNYSIKQSMGMSYIVHLIERAYNNDEPEIHAAELIYVVNGRPPVNKTTLDSHTIDQLEALGLSVTGLGEGLEVMGQAEKEWIRGKIRELERQIEEMEEDGNLGEVFRLREEKEAIEDGIAKESGLAGRGRKVADHTTQVRQAVSKNIGNALRHIIKKDGAELAAYLKDHCKLGLFCSFRKDPSIHWQIGFISSTTKKK